MRVDLHTHSSVSDGTDTPSDLVRKAKSAGLDVIGLTDHDTAVGWAAAQTAADEVGITLVPGMEISTRLEGRSVHLLAFGIDPENPRLTAALDDVLAGRNSRVPAICAKLRELGLDITEDDVRRRAGDAAATGRPHIADAMIERGHVASRDEAFAKFLNPGKPAYVTRTALDVYRAISLVSDAGGVSVIAHPWGRSRRALTPDRLAELRSLGLAGIEVDHQEHDPSARAELRGLAADLGLIATGSSDYHGTGKVDHDLGCNTTDPLQWERLQELITSGPSTGRPATPGSG